MTHDEPQRSTRSASLLGAVIAVLLAPGCATQPAQQALPPQTMAAPGPEIEEPVSTTPQEMPPEVGATPVEGVEANPVPTDDDESSGGNEAETEPAETGADTPSDDITVVIEPPTAVEEQPTSLVAAARAERARRARADESRIVITDKNLAEHAAGGQLTFVDEEPEVDGEADGEAEDDTESADDEGADTEDDSLAEEEYWRDRIEEIRRSWHDAVVRLEELEDRIAALRQDFYAEDDPFYRDSQIKPEWDRALDDLEETRRTAREEEENLAVALDEGRRAGALPGWLREGLELEPTLEELEAAGLATTERERDEDGFHRPSEPVVLDDGGDHDEGEPGHGGATRR